MAILGHAASAEDGSGFGIQGDQTGREVRLDTLGQDGNNWVYIYRYPGSKTIVNNIGEAARQACQNDHIGYSMERSLAFGIERTRYGLWEAMSETGDIRKITKDVNCDCSALVISCIRIAGVPNAYYYKEMVTAIEDNVLTTLGFQRLPYNIWAVQKGDVLWREGHTGIVVEGNENTKKSPSTTPITVKAATTYVYVRTSPEVKNAANGYPINVLPQWQMLGPGNLVDVCDTTYAAGWSYIRIAGKFYGWVQNEYLKAPQPVVPKVGDKVQFTGQKIYVSSYANGKGVAVPNFVAKITQKNSQAHPYLIKSIGPDGLEGWANEKDLTLI